MGEEQILDYLASTKSPWGFALALILVLAMVSGLFSKAAADYGGIFGTVSPRPGAAQTGGYCS